MIRKPGNANVTEAGRNQQPLGKVKQGEEFVTILLCELDEPSLMSVVATGSAGFGKCGLNFKGSPHST